MAYQFCPRLSFLEPKFEYCQEPGFKAKIQNDFWIYQHYAIPFKYVKEIKFCTNLKILFYQS
jgi:hypothetical protein